MGESSTIGREKLTWVPLDGGIRLDASNSDRCWKMVHTQYAFCVIKRGGADWHYRGRRFQVGPGALYVLEPGEVHSTLKAHGPGDYTVYFMDAEWVGRMSDEFGAHGTPHFAPEGLHSKRLWQEFAATVSTAPNTPRSALESSETLSQQVSATLSAALLAQSWARTPLAAATLQKARAQIRDTVRDNPSQTVDIRALARDLETGYHTLIRDFSRHFGAAPYQYVALLRSHFVVSRLRQGPTETIPSLTALARHAGYSDAAHMSRHVREHFGLPPRDIAKQLNPAWGRRK